MAAQHATLRLRASDDFEHWPLRCRPPEWRVRLLVSAPVREHGVLLLQSGEGDLCRHFISCSGEPLLVVVAIPLRPVVDREVSLVQRIRELAVGQIAHLAEHALVVDLVRLLFIFTIVSGIEVTEADRVRVLDVSHRDASRVLLLGLALLDRRRALHLIEAGSVSRRAC